MILKVIKALRVYELRCLVSLRARQVARRYSDIRVLPICQNADPALTDQDILGNTFRCTFNDDNFLAQLTSWSGNLAQQDSRSDAGLGSFPRLYQLVL